MYEFFYSLWSILIFLVFAVIVYWSFNPKSKQRFESAAQIPFQEDGLEQSDKPSNTREQGGSS